MVQPQAAHRGPVAKARLTASELASCPKFVTSSFVSIGEAPEFRLSPSGDLTAHPRASYHGRPQAMAQSPSSKSAARR